MSKETGVIVLGGLVVFFALSGFPMAWRTGLVVLAGIGLVLLGLFMRSRLAQINHGSQDSFTESAPASLAGKTKESHEKTSGVRA